MRCWGIILGLSLGLLSLMSCGKAANSTVQYAFWGDPTAIGVEKDIIAQFNEAHPHITIEPIVAPYNDYPTKLLTLIAGGAAPDVMRIDSLFREQFKDTLLPLDDLIKKDNWDMSMYYPDGLIDSTYNGTVIGLPWGFAPFFFNINIAVLEQYGLEKPSLDWTFEDFITLINEIDAKSKGESGKFFVNMGELKHIDAFVWAYGGSFYSEDFKRAQFNSPEVLQGLSILQDWYQRKIIPDYVLGANSTSKQFADFVNNKIFISFGSAAEILTLKKAGAKFDAYPAPIGIKSRATTMVKANLVGIYQKTKKQDAAWEFLKFLRGPEGEMLYAKATRVPPSINRKELWDAYIGSAEYPRNFMDTINTINSGRARLLPLLKNKNNAQINALIPAIWQAVLTQNKDLSTAMDELVSKIDPLLQQ